MLCADSDVCDIVPNVNSRAKFKARNFNANFGK